MCSPWKIDHEIRGFPSHDDLSRIPSPCSKVMSVTRTTESPWLDAWRKPQQCHVWGWWIHVPLWTGGTHLRWHQPPHFRKQNACGVMLNHSVAATSTATAWELLLTVTPFVLMGVEHATKQQEAIKKLGKWSSQHCSISKWNWSPYLQKNPLVVYEILFRFF